MMAKFLIVMKFFVGAQLHPVMHFYAPEAPVVHMTKFPVIAKKNTYLGCCCLCIFPDITDTSTMSEAILSSY